MAQIQTALNQAEEEGFTYPAGVQAQYDDSMSTLESAAQASGVSVNQYLTNVFGNNLITESVYGDQLMRMLQFDAYANAHAAASLMTRLSWRRPTPPILTTMTRSPMSPSPSPALLPALPTRRVTPWSPPRRRRLPPRRPPSPRRMTCWPPSARAASWVLWLRPRTPPTTKMTVPLILLAAPSQSGSLTMPHCRGLRCGGERLHLLRGGVPRPLPGRV